MNTPLRAVGFQREIQDFDFNKNLLNINILEMKWITKITQILGIKYPLVMGAFGGWGKAEFASTFSNAGGLGILAALNFPNPKEFKKDITYCHLSAFENRTEHLFLHTVRKKSLKLLNPIKKLKCPVVSETWTEITEIKTHQKEINFIRKSGTYLLTKPEVSAIL